MGDRRGLAKLGVNFVVAPGAAAGAVWIGQTNLWSAGACAAVAVLAPHVSLYFDKRTQAEANAARTEHASQRAMEALKSGVRRLSNMLEAGHDTDPSVPGYRITVFVPRETSAGIVLAPYLRMKSTETVPVLYGNRDFTVTKSFTASEALVGSCWKNGESKIRSIEPLAGMNNDLNAWEKQWLDNGSSNPRDWSLYMRHVASMWVFPIPNGKRREDVEDSFAVFSVDAIRPGAFDARAAENDTSLFKYKNLRHPIASEVTQHILLEYHQDTSMPEPTPPFTAEVSKKTAPPDA